MSEIAFGPVQGIGVRECQAEPVDDVAAAALTPGIGVTSDVGVAPQQAAQITQTVVIVGAGCRVELPCSHQFVVRCEVRATPVPGHGAGHVFPATFGQEPVIAAGDDLGAVRQPDSVGRFVCAPVCLDGGLYVAPIHTLPPGADNPVPWLQPLYGNMAAVRHKDGCVAVQTVWARMLAAPVGIDRGLERDVRRAVAGDDRARRVRAQLGGRGLGFLLGAAPAVVEHLVIDRLEAAGGIGYRAPPLERLSPPCLHFDTV